MAALASLKELPDRIWNTDVTGLRFEHNPVKVIREKGAKNVVINPAKMEPLLLFWRVVMRREYIFHLSLVKVKGKTSIYLLGYNTTAAPPNTKWVFSDKGWNEMCSRNMYRIDHNC